MIKSLYFLILLKIVNFILKFKLLLRKPISNDGFYNPPNLNSLSNIGDPVLNAFKMKNSQTNMSPLMVNGSSQANIMGGFSGFNNMNGLNSPMGLQNQNFGQQLLPNINGFNPNMGVLPGINNMNQVQGFQNAPQSSNLIPPSTLTQAPSGYNFKQKEQAPSPVNNFFKAG
jgi:hypothetical protein